MDDTELRAVEERNVQASREAFVKEWDEEEEQAARDYEESKKGYSQFIVDIHGKSYMTVAGRIKEFWDLVKKNDFAGSSITTKITINDSTIICKATAILGVDWKATGHASEVIGSSNINKTSALENAETSAIGRALANLGIGIIEGGSVASADEVKNALSQQPQNSQQPAKFATDKQKDFLTKLTKEKKGGVPDPKWLETLSLADAKKHIDKLMNMKPIEPDYIKEMGELDNYEQKREIHHTSKKILDESVDYDK